MSTGRPEDRSTSRRRWLGYAGAGLVAVAAGGVVAWQSREQDDPGALLLAQSFPTPQGQSQALDAWRGKVMVVNFWATWCAPCVDEMPDLDSLHAEWGDAAVVVGVGVDTPENITRFLQKVPVSYPLVIAGASGAALTRELGNDVGGLPYTVIIDRQGRVSSRFAGRIHPQALRDAVGRLTA